MKIQTAMEATNLVKNFGDYTAIDGISICVKAGEIFGILGPNGAGKTTFIRMMSTLIKPNGGIGKVFGYDIVKEPDKVRQLIGLTGQYATVDEDLTARENLIVFCKLCGLNGKQAKRRSEELLEEFSLTEASDKPLKNFSGGMRRRLDLAVSLISKPPLIFLDEPTTGLDPRTRAQMWNTIRKLVRAGSTIILTTQYLEEADQLADRIAVIDKGSVVALGAPDELKERIGNSVLQFKLKNEEQIQVAIEATKSVIREKVSINLEQYLISAPVKGTNAIQELLTVLNNKGIEIAELSLKKPSLDEVFLAITDKEN